MYFPSVTVLAALAGILVWTNASAAPASAAGMGASDRSTAPRGTSTTPGAAGTARRSSASGDTSGPAAVLSSNTGNVHLDSGTQLILLVQ